MYIWIINSQNLIINIICLITIFLGLIYIIWINYMIFKKEKINLKIIYHIFSIFILFTYLFRLIYLILIILNINSKILIMIIETISWDIISCCAIIFIKTMINIIMEIDYTLKNYKKNKKHIFICNIWIIIISILFPILSIFVGYYQINNFKIAFIFLSIQFLLRGINFIIFAIIIIWYILNYFKKNNIIIKKKPLIIKFLCYGISFSCILFGILWILQSIDMIYNYIIYLNRKYIIIVQYFWYSGGIVWGPIIVHLYLFYKLFPKKFKWVQHFINF